VIEESEEFGLLPNISAVSNADWRDFLSHAALVHRAAFIPFSTMNPDIAVARDREASLVQYDQDLNTGAPGAMR
jgi:hypothetical protein